jgi:hypothetical protein
MNPRPDRQPKMSERPSGARDRKAAQTRRFKPLFPADYSCARATTRIDRFRIENL